MDTCIIFCVGALAAMASEAFWYGASRSDIALWGGTGMLLLRRILLRFPFGEGPWQQKYRKDGYPRYA